MTNTRILQIVHEEINRENRLLFEGVTTYTPHEGYRNNKLIESNYGNGRQLLTEGVIDTIQTALEWAGFIPGIGDLLDIANAAIYYFRDMIFDAAFNLVAAIPGVGSFIAAPFKLMWNGIKKFAAPVIKALAAGGSGAKAASALMNIFKSGRKGIRDLMLPMYQKVGQYATKIDNVLGRIDLSALNNKIKDVSYGWLALPSSFVKAGDGFINKMRQFLVGLSDDVADVIEIVTKDQADRNKEKVVNSIKGVSSEEKKEILKVTEATNIDDKKLKKYIAAWEKSDKKRYPTLVSYIKQLSAVTLKGGTCVTAAPNKGWLYVGTGKDRKKLGNVRKGTVATVDGLKTKVTKVWKDKNEQPAGFKFKNGIDKATKLCFQITKKGGFGGAGGWITPKIHNFMLTSLEKKPIQLWSRGDTVKIVQKALQIEPDGVFQQGTEKAVKKFQRDKGMIPDGVVGPKTWLQLV